MHWDCCSYFRDLRQDRLRKYGVRVVGEVDPENEPVTMEDARAHLRVDTFGSPPESDDDFWIQNIGLPGAREWAELYSGVSIGLRSMELAMNRFPSGSVMTLPFGPVDSVTSIVYDDADGVEQIMDPADYTIDYYTGSLPSIRLAPGASWPTDARDQFDAIRVLYFAGYTPAGASPPGLRIPASMRSAILLMLGHLYENREAVNVGNIINEFPLGARQLLDLSRVRLGMA